MIEMEKRIESRIGVGGRSLGIGEGNETAINNNFFKKNFRTKNLQVIHMCGIFSI